MGCAGSSNKERIISEVSHKTKESKSGVRDLYDVFETICPDMKMSPELFVAFFLHRNGQLEDPHPFLVIFLAKLFRAFDDDGNGVMDFEEFVTLMHTLLSEGSDDMLEAVFKVIDDDKSGTIEEDEFISTVVYLAAFNPEEIGLSTLVLFVLAEDVFKKVDTEKTGSIDMNLFLEALIRDLSGTTDGIFKLLVALIYKSMVRILTANPPIPKKVITINIIEIRIQVAEQRSELEKQVQTVANKQ